MGQKLLKLLPLHQLFCPYIEDNGAVWRSKHFVDFVDADVSVCCGLADRSFRKYYATEIYKDRHYNIALVQQLLQHSSTSVTQRYIGIQQREVETAIESHLQLDV